MNHPHQLTLEELQNRIKDALRQWHTDTGESSPFAPLHLFQQLRHRNQISEHEATNRVLHQALQILAERYPRDAQLLHRSDLDNALNDFVANELNIGESTLYRHKNAAIARLAKVLFELDQQTHSVHRARLLARLASPSHTQLLGIEQHLHHLTQLLASPGAPWIVALAGIGGIGKTTLADAVVRELVDQGAVHEVGWVTARQTVLQWHGSLQQVEEPALTLDALAEQLCNQLLDQQLASAQVSSRDPIALLRGQLKERPHLIVIDNLETVSDLESVVMALRDLSEPTKFLLTSRESLFNQPDIYHYAVPELSSTDALKLIRQEAHGRNLVHLVQARDDELLPIIEIVGGNPLALRLIVGQTYIHPLQVVLENLAKARGTQTASLYTYLYFEVWQRLNEMARRTLLAMPLVTPTGAELAHLVEVCELEETVVIEALESLVRLNLVDMRGDLYQRRYSIHNLTRTFLHEQVLRWQ
jgi:hypothetical protein